MIQVAYTNYNCKDVLPTFIKQNRKHTDLPLFLISDYDVSEFDIDGYFIYDNSENYWEVWNNALKEFGSENFIYLQEDFFLYADVDGDTICDYTKTLNESEKSFVRLAKCITFNEIKSIGTLYEIECTNRNVFAMQSTIWKTADYIKLMELVKEPKWLETNNYPRIMAEVGMEGFYHYDGEPKRGRSHWDSNVYPYIATAIVKGKWNISEYSELQTIINTENIQVNLRGTR
jgi:hypothetical protein